MSQKFHLHRFRAGLMWWRALRATLLAMAAALSAGLGLAQGSAVPREEDLVAGQRMGFQVDDAQERADLIACLASLK